MSSNDKYNLQKNSDFKTLESFRILIFNVKSLKDKTWGCPWQKIQSHVSLIPFLYEEINENNISLQKKAHSFYKRLKPEPQEQRFAFFGVEIRNPPPLKSP